jgi:hypothetical protein
MDPAVEEHLASVTPAKRQRDAHTLVELMQRVTGLEPTMWRSGIVGFGSYHYKYASGREGDAPAASFAPRKAATTIYVLDGLDSHADDLEQLGPHTTGVGCLYLKDLADIDLDVLESVITKSWTALTDGTFARRAREAGRRKQ